MISGLSIIDMLYVKEPGDIHKPGGIDVPGVGDWKQVGGIGIKAGGEWHCCDGVYKKINGVWTEVWPRAKSTTVTLTPFTCTCADDGTGDAVKTDEFYYYSAPRSTYTIVYNVKYSTKWSGELVFYTFGAHVTSYKFSSTNGSPTTYVKSEETDVSSNCDSEIHFSGNDWKNTGATETITITASIAETFFEVYTKAVGRISATGKVTYLTYNI